jgi:hypothetical protein
MKLLSKGHFQDRGQSCSQYIDQAKPFRIEKNIGHYSTLSIYFLPFIILFPFQDLKLSVHLNPLMIVDHTIVLITQAVARQVWIV